MIEEPYHLTKINNDDVDVHFQNIPQMMYFIFIHLKNKGAIKYESRRRD